MEPQEPEKIPCHYPKHVGPVAVNNNTDCARLCSRGPEAAMDVLIRPVGIRCDLGPGHIVLMGG